jgi:hypothetical protein
MTKLADRTANRPWFAARAIGTGIAEFAFAHPVNAVAAASRGRLAVRRGRWKHRFDFSFQQ